MAARSSERRRTDLPSQRSSSSRASPRVSTAPECAARASHRRAAGSGGGGERHRRHHGARSLPDDHLASSRTTPHADLDIVRGRVKPHAPPFMMLGVNLENTTSSDFRMTVTARYLAFETVGSGSELRVDATLGSNPRLGIELYRPIGSTPLFVAPYAGVGRMTFDLIEDDAVVARYKQKLARIGLNAGVNLGAHSDGASVRSSGTPPCPSTSGTRLARTAGEGDGGESCLACGYAGQSGGASWSVVSLCDSRTSSAAPTSRYTARRSTSTRA